MNKSQRTITGLLAAVAVLLAANLLVMLNREAEAQPTPGIDPLTPIAPWVVGLDGTGCIQFSLEMVRAWVDGLVEYWDVDNAVWVPVPEDAGSYEPPEGVRLVDVEQSGLTFCITRIWSDGYVEYNQLGGPAGVWLGWRPPS